MFTNTKKTHNIKSAGVHTCPSNLKRTVTCVSAYQLTVTNPSYSPCCCSSSRLPQTDAAHPQVRVFTTTEPLSGQQLRTAFLLSDPTLLSCGGCGARCWSLLAERKRKYVKEKIIVLKRGQGLGGKANFLSSSDQLVRAPCTGQRKAFGNS